MMILPGLVSVTFRQLSPEQVVALAAKAQLRGVEWGGDIHVPPGDAVRARAAGALCRDAGLAVVSYGSYYRVGFDSAETFRPILDSALELGAPNIRVWAGKFGSSHTTAIDRQRVGDDLRRIVQASADSRLTVSLEFHDGTLADTPHSTLALLTEIAHPALRTYWQPPHGQPIDEACAGLRLLLPRLSHLHVFHWWPDAKHRLPLADGSLRWTRFLDVATQAPGDRFALLEFVRQDSAAAFLRDAAVLRSWLPSPTLGAQ